MKTSEGRDLILYPAVVHLRVLPLLVLIGIAAGADVNICENVANNLFVPHVSNCSEYYLCMGKFVHFLLSIVLFIILYYQRRWPFLGRVPMGTSSTLALKSARS